MRYLLTAILLVALNYVAYLQGKHHADKWYAEHPVKVELIVPAPVAPAVYSTKELLVSDEACGHALVCLLPDGHVAQNDSVGWTIKDVLISESTHTVEGTKP